MNSEDLYRYSKIQQCSPGFSVVAGSRAQVVYEYANAWKSADGFGVFSIIQGMGRYQCSAQTVLRREPISSYDLIYVRKGRVQIQKNGTVRLAEGDVYETIDERSYTLEPCGDEGAEFILLSYYGTVGERYGKLIAKADSGCISLRSRKEMDNLLETMEFYLKYPLQVNQILSLNILTQILTEVYLSTLDREAFTVTGQPKWLIASIQYIEENYQNKLTTEEMAKNCGFSCSYFQKLFRESTGVSPHEYLLKLRLTRAKNLLLTTSFPVKYVAYCVGLPSVNHFIAYFREETGLTPDNFRKQG